KEREIFAVLAAQKDAVAPDDRGRAARAGERQLPGEVLAGAPLGREVGFLADAIALRPAPLRPIVGIGAAGKQGKQQESQARNDQTAIDDETLHSLNTSWGRSDGGKESRL